LVALAIGIGYMLSHTMTYDSFLGMPGPRAAAVPFYALACKSWLVAGWHERPWILLPGRPTSD